MSDQTVTISQDEYNALNVSKALVAQYEEVLTNLVEMVGIVNRDAIASQLIPRGLLLGLFNDPTNG